jgi:O-antigen ligase
MSTVDKTFHKIAHGYYVNTPWTGICLITPAFFVANESDYKIYEDENEKEFFKIIYNKLYQKQLNIHHLDSTVQDKAAYYITNFSKISNKTVCDEGKIFVGKQLTENEKYIAVDSLTKKMTFPLILKNFKEWLKLYIKNFINAFGNGNYTLLYFTILIFSLYGLIKLETTTFKLIALLSLITIFNVALVAIGMHTIKRFTFYNDWVLFLILIILLDTVLKFNKANEK